MSEFKMLTIKEASRLVEGLTEYRIRAMCIDGTLPCIKAGKKYLICSTVLYDVLCKPAPSISHTEAGITPIEL